MRLIGLMIWLAAIALGIAAEAAAFAWGALTRGFSGFQWRLPVCTLFCNRLGGGWFSTRPHRAAGPQEEVMFRTHILTAVALLAMCVVPGFAYGMVDQPVAPSSQSYQDLRSPDARDAQSEPVSQVAYQDLRSPDARDAKTEPVTQVAQDLRSPDAKSAAGNYVESPQQVAQDLRSPDAKSAAGNYVESPQQFAQDLRSPDARDAGQPQAPTSDTIVEIREVPGSGFDWGDAGIGAAGLLAMLSIAGGLALMLTTRRRRRGTEMPAH